MYTSFTFSFYDLPSAVSPRVSSSAVCRRAVSNPPSNGRRKALSPWLSRTHTTHSISDHVSDRAGARTLHAPRSLQPQSLAAAGPAQQKACARLFATRPRGAWPDEHDTTLQIHTTSCWPPSRHCAMPQTRHAVLRYSSPQQAATSRTQTHTNRACGDCTQNPTCHTHCTAHAASAPALLRAQAEQNLEPCPRPSRKTPFGPRSAGPPQHPAWRLT